MNIITLGQIIFVLFMIWVTYVFIIFYKRDNFLVSTERRTIEVDNDSIPIDSIDFIKVKKAKRQPNPFEYLLVSYLFSSLISRPPYICDFEINFKNKNKATYRLIHQSNVLEELTKARQLTTVIDKDNVFLEVNQFNVKPYIVVGLTAFLITVIAIAIIQRG